VAVRDVFEVCGYKTLNDIEILADGQRAYLLVIPDHDDPLPQIAGNQGHHVALTRLVNDDDIEACCAWIKLLDYSGQGHNPHWHGTPTLTHEPDGLNPKLRRPAACPPANSSDCVGPSDQRLSLTKTNACGLRRPRLTIDKFGGGPTQLGR
jgi:hypothetical protein